MTTFTLGRDLAAGLGLMPRQVTTGGTPKLFGLTKCGSRYLRKTQIQGVRAALPSLHRNETHLGQWLRSLLARTRVNATVVVLAAKLEQCPIGLNRLGF